MSSPLPDLAISGATLQLQWKHIPHLPTRKFFHATTCVQKVSYQHEIANHYRDFMRRPRIASKRRSVLVRHLRPNWVEYTHECRDFLPVAVHNFPRFSEVYTARGRRTLCESEPPDETCNDTVRRIRAANSCKELAVLVQRQVHFRSGSQGGRTYHENWATSSGYQRRAKNNHNDKQGKRQTSNAQQQQSQSRHIVPYSHVEGGGTQQSESRKVLKKDAGVDKATSYEQYLQLASDYYEQGFLSTIKYLESVGERNAIVRQYPTNNKHLQWGDDIAAKKLQETTSALSITKAGHSATSAGSNSSLESAVSNATPLTTSSEPATPRLLITATAIRAATAAENCFRLTALLQRIGHKRSFRVSSTNSVGYDDDDTCDRNNTNKEWAIKVNIIAAKT